MSNNRMLKLLSLWLPIFLYNMDLTQASNLDHAIDLKGSERILQLPENNCMVYNEKSGLCVTCYEYYDNFEGLCVTRYTLDGLLYTIDDHPVNFDIDYNGSDVPIDVIFGILAAIIFMGSGFMMLVHKEDWTKLAPPEEGTAEGKVTVKEAAKETHQPQQAKGSKDQEEEEQGVELAGKTKGHNNTNDDDVETGTAVKRGDEVDEDEEEAYYPDVGRTDDNRREKPKRAPAIDEDEDEELEEGEGEAVENSNVEVKIDEEEEEGNVKNGRPSHVSHKSHHSQRSQKSQNSPTFKKPSPSRKSRNDSNHSNADDHEDKKQDEEEEQNQEEDHDEAYEEGQQEEEEQEEPQEGEEEQEEEEENEEEEEKGSKHDEDLEEEDGVMDLEDAFNGQIEKPRINSEADDYDPNSSNTGFMKGGDSKRF